MVGAMGTRRLSANIVPREKWSLKSLFCPQFESSIIEKKYILRYLKIIYPSSHRLLVTILISHAFINSIEILAFNTLAKQAKIIHLILLAISIAFNVLSLIIILRLRNRILSNLTSLICLCPLAILSCLYPSECHIYLLIILLYTLANVSLLLSVLISILITIIIAVLTLETRICLILILISNMIGVYLNRLWDITMRSAYHQLCKSKLNLNIKTKANLFLLLLLDANAHGSLSTEHTLISKMIDSLMPRKYAKGIMEDFDVFRERVQNVNISHQGDDDLQMTVFRPLHIERMENVSILFADIVGFTHMSSNKTASQLVSLLSDLYGRFDDLCVQMSCEKIATLGDCYYCVSGCPEPREDHAKSCVLMGLAMINAIEEFDEDNHEQVDMRVGVNSGSVNCGIVGTRKFKFDIFSNDVTLANKMESTGKPGKSNLIIFLFSYLFILQGYVHITEATHSLLKADEFQFEEGPPYILPSRGMF
jgi:adenylate cyclase 9